MESDRSESVCATIRDRTASEYRWPTLCSSQRPCDINSRQLSSSLLPISREATYQPAPYSLDVSIMAYLDIVFL